MFCLEVIPDSKNSRLQTELNKLFAQFQVFLSLGYVKKTPAGITKMNISGRRICLIHLLSKPSVCES